ncbi:hypothetical protein BC936DRAFT_141416, partial [Jimgerdemannia flammicorona]
KSGRASRQHYYWSLYPYIYIRPSPFQFGTLPNMSNSLTFVCLLHGDPVENAFPIDITTSKLVGHLKDKIKEKKAPYFNHIAADELTLYRVNVSVNCSDWLKDLDLERYTESIVRKLFPTDDILDVLPYPPGKRCIHLIVVPPAIVPIVSPIIASTMMSRISVIEKELEEMKDQLTSLKSPMQAKNQSTNSDTKSDIVESPTLHGEPLNIVKNDGIAHGNLIGNVDPRVPPDVASNSLRCVVCVRSSPENGGNLNACAACASVLYCSKECQTADWKIHKSACRRISRRNIPINEIDPRTGFFKNAFSNNICLYCGTRPTKFPTEASRREYGKMSRICPSCWHISLLDPDSPLEEIERSRRDLHACGRILILQKSFPHAWQCLCCREVIWNKQQRQVHATKKCTTDLNILRQRNEVGA